eukprot:CAMPEP_0181250132 /NCGR_PEP_ID=MMETSP1096-20121128/46148_1 /TAXON_ID=156174 ORGANISM="Chrysochromulina ericina, Strain CCMP281" /NCGR_SAMPLE_ID=MMETSP1096 /ASSEMBLY_ACC=CAM_ASM_000453 /LENGTH=86 /DNA_ID=CAMNT_0023347563 /DNA_START=106 /DNA_END=366 /DNA_ORIENTATION=-
MGICCGRAGATPTPRCAYYTFILNPEVYYNATKLGAFTICADEVDKRCSSQWDLLQTLSHTCDHSSYLGLNPSDCGAARPRCEEPH